MKMKVRDLMTSDPVTVAPDSTLREVAEKLSAEHVGGVPVVTAGRRLVGVVSATDLIDFLAASAVTETERPSLGSWEERPEADDEESAPQPATSSAWWPPIQPLFEGPAGERGR